MTHAKVIDILLVEDLLADGQLILRALRSKGFGENVLWVRDGAAALDFLLHRGAHADKSTARFLKLVLLDVKLPKVDGIEVLTTMRMTTELQTIPVVMLTSSMERRDLERCYAAGANSYVVKPVDFDRLIDAVGTTAMYWMQYNVALGQPE